MLSFKASTTVAASLLMCVSATSSLAQDRTNERPKNIVVTAANALDRTVEPWEEMAGGSILTRNHRNRSITLQGFTTSLAPNTAYSVWWAIYNKPENCVDGSGEFDVVGCGKDEVEDPELAIASDTSLLWASGFISDANGNGQFTAVLQEGNAPGEVMLGEGLTNAMGAEVHFLLREHGPLEVGSVDKQLSTFMQSCMPEGNYPCADVQGGVHRAPEM